MKINRNVRRKGYNEYPYTWGMIADRIKQSNDWACERCGRTHSPSNGFSLTVHHIDRDKANCADWNLACLCQRCHLEIQNKLDFNQMYMFDLTDWLRPHYEGYLAAISAGKYTPRA